MLIRTEQAWLQGGARQVALAAATALIMGGQSGVGEKAGPRHHTTSASRIQGLKGDVATDTTRNKTAAVGYGAAVAIMTKAMVAVLVVAVVVAA